MQSNQQFSASVNSIIAHWKKANPTRCHRLGIHDYDGELPNYTAVVVSKRCEEIENDLKQLTLVEEKVAQNKLTKFEFNLLKMALQTELFELKEEQAFKEDPSTFIRPLGSIESSYTARSFAPIEDRIQLIIKFEEKKPAFLASAEHILNPQLAKVKISMAQQFLRGIINYYQSKLQTFIQQSKDPQKVTKWKEVNTKAIKAMEIFAEKLQKVYLPKAHTKFALGEEKYLKLLKYTEHIDITVEELIKIGEEDLEHNYQQLQDIIKEKGEQSFLEIMNEIPESKNLIQEATYALERKRKFVLESGIDTDPSDKQCIATETPEFSRGFGFASMNTPGPFEVPEAAEAYYYITPPDPTLSEEQKRDFLKYFNRGRLEGVTIHEAWPGHYLQLLYTKQSRSEISKMFAHSITMIEGWAHYCEEMVLDQGYAPFDKTKLKIGQLLRALQRDCRFLSAVKMHCKGMTVEESTKLFMEKAYFPQKNAEVEARRGTIDPMYLNYTLGKLLIKKLRSDYQREQGEIFSLKKFHDELLSYGGSPIVALREMLLKNTENIKQIL